MPKSTTLVFFFFFLNHFIQSSFAVNQQGEALLSWKTSLNGSLQALNNWDPTDETPCLWFGITCNFKNEVMEMNLKDMDLMGGVPSNLSSLISLQKIVLSGTNLTGSIPKEIGYLQGLKFLDLSDNSLVGEIPVEICSLILLQELYLNSNQLEGSIPVQTGNLTSIVELILYDNQLTGTIPNTIGNLKKLQVFRAGGNKNLEGSLPLEIGNCTNLIMLGLAETSISGFLPSTIGNLKKLITLAIYTALLSGQIPPELGDCVSLQNIYLYQNSLTGSIPASFGQNQNLQNLLLWQNNLVGIIPPEIGNCKQLVVLDVSLNSLTGSIPATFGNLSSFNGLMLSVNQISGRIPSELGNCTGLTHIELDNNQLTGTIPLEFGNLLNLTLLFLWANRLEGEIPVSLSSCSSLEAIDLSQNALTGNIPKGIFLLQNLNKLLLLSNNLSGIIPPEIGKCSSLIRFRASQNMLTGYIPKEIGNLKNLAFFDLGSNRLTGMIPPEISGCRNLTFIDLHSNSIGGNLPENLTQLVSLQFLDVSDNVIEGTLSPNVNSLNSLNKLIIAKNRFSGLIPGQLGSCSKLQLLDLSSNMFSGEIPSSLGKIPALEIALNLSWNQLTGPIPSEFTGLDRLGVLDLSHNQLSGDLHFLADLQNLVTLNVSDNNFTGHVPDTPFFSKLPVNVLSGNPQLCISGNKCSADSGGSSRRSKVARLAMVVVLSFACVLLSLAVYIIIRNKKHDLEDPHSCTADRDNDMDMTPPWEVVLYQKLDLSVDDVAKSITPTNVIGRGQSGLVYRSILPTGLIIAVKRFQTSEKFSSSAFSSEISTLSRIRHRNIVRLLGWAANQKTKMLFYDYMTNGTLGTLLHGDQECGGIGNAIVEWETRFNIALGIAEGLSYLHHDCVPPILHRDVKSDNILLGDRYEPCLADFGLARLLVEDENKSFNGHPQFAGSYGYFAPEYGCMLKITEKSDVFSYGVVLLEIITGKKPVDPSFTDNQHVIQWVRDHLKRQKDPVDIIDPKLQGRPDTQLQEMFQALGISLLCTSNRADDRPTMKDVVALLRGIRHESPTGGEVQKPVRKSATSPLEVVSNSSSSSLVTTTTTPAQMFHLEESPNCSLSYSSMANYNGRKK